MQRILTSIFFLAVFLLASYAAEPDHTKVVDTQSMPWQHGGLRLSKNWALKILEEDSQTGRRVAIAYLPAGLVTHEGRHYHQFRQWFYFLHGDIPVFDFTAPEQKKPRVNILREGYFVDRPVASMHGDGGPGDPVSQEGSMFVMWLENSLPSKQVPIDGPYPQTVEYRDDSILDTRSMQWSKSDDGTMQKILSTTVRLVLYPPAWKGPRVTNGLSSALVIYGDGMLEANGTRIPLREGAYIRQPQGDPVQLAVGDVGCQVLEWTEPGQTRDSARSQ